MENRGTVNTSDAVTLERSHSWSGQVSFLLRVDPIIASFAFWITLVFDAVTLMESRVERTGSIEEAMRLALVEERGSKCQRCLVRTSENSSGPIAESANSR